MHTWQCVFPESTLECCLPQRTLSTKPLSMGFYGIYNRDLHVICCHLLHAAIELLTLKWQLQEFELVISKAWFHDTLQRGVLHVWLR